VHNTSARSMIVVVVGGGHWGRPRDRFVFAVLPRAGEKTDDFVARWCVFSPVPLLNFSTCPTFFFPTVSPSTFLKNWCAQPDTRTTTTRASLLKWFVKRPIPDGLYKERTIATRNSSQKTAEQMCSRQHLELRK
jgi:hypothetical protein